MFKHRSLCATTLRKTMWFFLISDKDATENPFSFNYVFCEIWSTMNAIKLNKKTKFLIPTNIHRNN